MRPLSAAAIVAIVALGVTTGIAYAAFPNSGGDDARSAAPAVHEVRGPQVGGSAPRKFAHAKCPAGEHVLGGGYSLQGSTTGKGYGFNTWGSPRPEAIPIVTESRASGNTDSWTVYATAPSNVSGKWWLQAFAICG